MSAYTVIIAARMTSERLPGKALVEYGGSTNLSQVVGRWRKSRRNPVIIVVASDAPEDAPIAEECQRIGVPFYLPPAFLVAKRNVISQLDLALRTLTPNFEHVARAMVDNPLVDVGLADWRYDTIERYGADGLHYGAAKSATGAWIGNHELITYAGTTDIWSRTAWGKIVEGSSGSQLEHPGSFYWEKLSRFDGVQIPLPPREYLTPARTELDTSDDLEMFRQLWTKMDATGREWSTLDALVYLEDHPELKRLNSHVEMKTQSRANWSHGMSWTCENCQGRTGAVVAGDFELPCPRCGKLQKFYAKKPDARHQRFAP